ncbi:MAG TPA: kelch repeat-containing protein [Nitrospiria bacterium]|jgi:hypothetical protein
MNTFIKIFLGLSLFSFLGCGSGNGGGEGQVTIISEDKLASVTIPPGALPDGMPSSEISVDVAGTVNLPDGNIGQAYEFKPPGTQFKQNVTISIEYLDPRMDPQDTPIPSGTSEFDLGLVKFDPNGNSWGPVENLRLDPLNNVVSGTTTSFSIYGIKDFGLGGSTTPTSTDMSGFRVNHTATPLYDGTVLVKVLFAGGRTIVDVNTDVLISGEIFNLSNNEFEKPTPVVFMKEARNGHSATLLSDNKTVLIAGGQGSRETGFAISNSAELFDSQQNKFELLQSTMTEKRIGHTATLLDNGEVLIAGGQTRLSNNPLIFHLSAELYDPTGRTFSPTSGLMNSPRIGHTATKLGDGTVLIAGGKDSNEGFLRTVELYNPVDGSFKPLKDLKEYRASHTATLLTDGNILIAGGFGIDGKILTSVEIYDPVAGPLAQEINMVIPRVHHTATILQEGSVLIAGGTSNGSNVLSSTELYLPSSFAFEERRSLFDSRFSHTATLLQDNSVLLTGGIGIKGVQNSAEIFKAN